MKKKLGEFDYIKRFSRMFRENLPGDVIGIGDDCAVIPYIDNHSLLMTTDTLVDSVHFLSEKMSPADLAYKSLTVNLSDIAAMGGKPLYALLALTIPPEIETDRLDEFFAGFDKACHKYSVNLLGGDITKTPGKLVITLTILGSAITENIKFRSTAQEGDYICVTGNIGDSVGGLYCYMNDLPSDKEAEALKKVHLNPRPHIKEGQWLSLHRGVNAMIDVSDGIESDIKRIMESSVCGAEIELDSLPLSRNYQKMAEKQGWNYLEMAVTGGEDYCLLLTVKPGAYNELCRSFEDKFAFPLPVIGKIVNKTKGLSFLLNGAKIKLKQRGYDHFL